MVTPPSVPSTPSLVPEPSEAPQFSEPQRQQLGLLFGESLFGAWPEIAQIDGRPPRRSRAKKWLLRLVFVSVMVLVAWGSQRLFQPGLVRQDTAEREHYAAELQSFLAEGELERVQEYLPIVQGNKFDAAVPQIDLVIFAEAALYRYYDADPARLAKLRPFLEQPNPSALRRVAQLTLLSREERAQHLPEIELLLQGLPNHPELLHLRATALMYRGDVEATQEAWKRSAKAGPAWFAHRFEQAQYEAAQGDAEAAKKVARGMLRTDPDNAWSKLAQGTFGVEIPADAANVRGDARAPAAPPVERFVENLLASIAQAKQAEGPAKERFLAALGQVHFEAPFLLDAFDTLLENRELGLLRELVRLEQWPKSSSVAQAKQQRMAQDGGKR